MHRPSVTAAGAVLLVGLALSVPQASASSAGKADRATPVNGDRLPATFPVVAAAGDIACDPSSLAFHHLRGQPGGAG